MKIILTYIAFGLGSGILFLLCAGLALHQYSKYKKSCGGVVNNDSFMLRHIFRLDFDGEEALNRLFVPNAADSLDYTLDASSQIITFYWCNGKYPYRLFFVDKDGHTFLMAVQKSVFSNRLCNRITPFFMEKLDAEPVDYVAYAPLFGCNEPEQP